MTTVTHPMSNPLHLPAPSWATRVDGEARPGITWCRVASIKPLAEPSCVGGSREEVEVSVERFDRIDSTADGFMLAEGRLLFLAGGDLFDQEQARRLHEALGELLAVVEDAR